MCVFILVTKNIHRKCLNSQTHLTPSRLVH